MKIEHNSHNKVYRNPFGAVESGSSVVIRIYADVEGIPESVNLVYYINNIEHMQSMHFIFNIAEGSVYETTLELSDFTGLVWYYFAIAVNGRKYYYGNNHARLGGEGRIYDHSPIPFQITVYKKGFETPNWFKNGIMYQIFPDRFCRGSYDSFKAAKLSGRNDIIERNWEDTPYYKVEQFGTEYLANDFFGGNLSGIIEKLPYLSDLGITIVYLNPIFKASTNHKYDTGDYESIDPMFGTIELFEELCEEANKYGIRIILDGVFNHTGSDSKYFNKYGNYPDKGAYQSQNSPYFKWYSFSDFPDKYDSWWGFDTLPNINELEPSYIEYILSSRDAIIKKWLRHGASGWRLDVADELPDSFLKIMRENAKKEKEDSVLVAEVWEDASNKSSYGQQKEYVFGEEFDSIMNYPFRNAIVDFCLCRITAYEFSNRIMSIVENYPAPVLHCLMNLLTTHDIERILTVLSGAPSKNDLSRDDKAIYKLNPEQYSIAKKRLKVASLLQFFLPGVPTIYYGDEAGMQGYEDPFNRMAYPWGKEDGDIVTWYRFLTSIRKQYSQLSGGEYELIYCYSQAYAMIRMSNDKRLCLAVNTSDSSNAFVRLDLARYNTEIVKDIVTGDCIEYKSGIAAFELGPLEYRILEC